MGKSEARERQQAVGSGSVGGVKTLGSADVERDLLAALIALLAYPGGELAGTEVLTALVEHNMHTRGPLPTLAQGVEVADLDQLGGKERS